jgi:hypothetical protein
MIILLCLLPFLVFGSIPFFILGEWIASKNENGNFAKWWRKNIVAPEPTDF